jgi:hypothetical protein
MSATVETESNSQTATSCSFRSAARAALAHVNMLVVVETTNVVSSQTTGVVTEQTEISHQNKVIIKTINSQCHHQSSNNVIKTNTSQTITNSQ